MEKQNNEIIRDLLILIALKSGVSYEAIAEVTHSSPKTVANRFPIKKVIRKRENA
jgi:hypothetical protein